MDATTALVELLLLLAVGLLTPGPNALTSFAHSGLFGKKANISLITGMAIGFVSIELIIGFLVNSLDGNETALTTLHWIGMVFLGAMVFAMFRIDPSKIEAETSEGKLGIKTGIAMQYVNGKEWAFIIIIMSQYMEPLGGGFVGMSVIILVTLVTCVSAMIAWTFFGDRLSGLFSDEKHGRRIFQVCGVLLSLLWVAFLIRGPAA
ncbi:MAG: LysE family translocator [Candidatus Poseidoniaceae archaeon]